MQFPNGRILIFARRPQTGAVKTRLIPALGAEGACALYRGLLDDLLQRLIDWQLCPIRLYWAPNRGEFNTPDNDAVSEHLQTGDGLGARMRNAFYESLQDADYAIGIGVDLPDLNADHLHAACECLNAGAQATFAPTEDGGYGLIGMQKVNDRLFENIDWGTSQVWAQTLIALENADLDWHALPELWDLDEPQDLARLPNSQVWQNLPEAVQKKVLAASRARYALSRE